MYQYEWVSDCCLMPIQQFFSYIMVRTNDDEVRFYTNTLSWIFIVLSHWNNSLWVDMSFHLDTSFWFWANQSLLFVLIGEVTNINFIVFWFARPWLAPTIYRTRGKHAIHYGTDAVCINMDLQLNRVKNGGK